MRETRHDAIGPEITAAVVDLLGHKAMTPWPRMVVLAVMSGMFIGFGSIAFLVAQAGPGAPAGVVQIVSGLGFAVGLILTMITGAELFTGNTMFILPAVRGTLGVGRMGAAWLVAWFGNLAGSVIVAILFVMAGGGKGVDGAVGSAAVEVATGKVDKSVVALMASGILANMLVCLAVWMAMSARSIPSKIIAIIGPVMVFVAAGFEHSIANQSLLPIGWMEQPGDAITVLAVVRNLAFVTVGNIIGGLVVALAFGYAHRAQ